jgi:hypothetical protein
VRPPDGAVAVDEGWNLVGVVGPGAQEPTRPPPAGPPCTAIWRYANPGGYAVPAQCEEGLGYWIKATGPATVWED